MGKDDAVCGNMIKPLIISGRPVTRALASAMRASSTQVSVTTQNQGRANTKRRVALDGKKANAPKKRAVLNDITNVNGKNSAPNDQINKEQGTSSSEASSQVTVSNSEGGSLSGCTATTNQVSRLPPRPLSRSTSMVETSCVGGSSTVASSPKFVDIDSDEKDPLLCSLYAPDIYYNLRVAELKRRPLPDYMERIQRDVTQTMRGILVDWLVEVSEDYKLVADTLYLTVYLVDWFLNGNYIERKRLQLLGITCLFIASKYEEIYAPRVEELCIITDNTCTRDQVLEMESKLLNHFSFQIYTPTPKTFLRRFLRVAQSSSQLNKSLEMEFLASYLAELTLVDYEFLKFLPSLIAASAVFLAKWTMNQSSPPWNPTLEHYTTYKASDLRECVQALQDVQLNTKGCPLNTIRNKYRQDKFKSVAAFTSPKLPDKLF